jgi:hypothetical protein
MDHEQELASLRSRIARLEARDDIEALFHRYLYSLDLDRAEEVLSCFADDAVLNVLNFPPGSGKDLRLVGPEGIRPLYDRHAGGSEPMIKGGHHAANVSVQVSADAATGDLSAYFLTAVGVRGFVQGGMYQVRAERRPEGWRVIEMNIISGWGWSVENVKPVTEPVAASRAWREGRPATAGTGLPADPLAEHPR